VAESYPNRLLFRATKVEVKEKQGISAGRFPKWEGSRETVKMVLFFVRTGAGFRRIEGSGRRLFEFREAERPQDSPAFQRCVG
jgi:hypothetical protein